jgi:hypothetical protein
VKISLVVPLTAAGLTLALASGAQEPNAAPTGAAPAPAPTVEPPPATPPQEAPGAVVSPAAKDQPQATAVVAPAEKQEPLDPIRNSVVWFDQSMTTQTAHLDWTPQQSYVPLYEWWFSFRPRYYFTDGTGRDDVYVAARLDYTKEWTNNQPTTDYREDVFGDIWLWLTYGHYLEEKKLTKVSVTGGLLLPTSKISQAEGIYFTSRAAAGLKRTFNLNGEEADWFSDMHLGLSFDYRHSFSNAQTPNSYGSFSYVREDSEGRSFISDQLTGTTLIEHQLWAVIDSGVQITPKLAFTLDAIFINNWHYAPPDEATVPIAGGTVTVPRASNGTLFEQETWMLANLEYDVLPEMSLSLGYYNLQNVIAPDGSRRGLLSGDNVWWSPDARVFFTITANLDKIYEDASGKYKGTQEETTKPSYRRSSVQGSSSGM